MSLRENACIWYSRIPSSLCNEGEVAYLTGCTEWNAWPKYHQTCNLAGYRMVHFVLSGGCMHKLLVGPDEMFQESSTKDQYILEVWDKADKADKLRFLDRSRSNFNQFTGTRWIISCGLATKYPILDTEPCIRKHPNPRRIVAKMEIRSLFYLIINAFF